MTNPLNIKVRFAPSPTGFLHVGGARTALFNYLFAKINQGSFLLRIEDTDKKRSAPEMTEAILRSLKWMGLDWDDTPVFQSERTTRYQEVCHALLESGNAYYCFCEQKTLAEKRENAAKSNDNFMYDRTCLRLSPAEIQSNLENNFPYVMRFKIPEGKTTFTDMVYGQVIVQNLEIDDFVIQRSDKSPVYQIAVVTDDHNMAISHVIRGDDHLSNTPKQLFIYEAMGWNSPQFAHLPLILGTDKKRFSKRHGATSVDAYKKKGYLPEAFVNFLALLGWSPGDNQEIMSLEKIIKCFSIDRISKKAAIFDEQKLLWMNSQYIQRCSAESLLEPVKKILIASRLISDNTFSDHYLLQFIHLMQPRVKLLSDFAQVTYFFQKPQNYDETALKKYWKKSGVDDRMNTIMMQLNAIDIWNEENIENCIRQSAEKLGISAGKLIHPIRVAISGAGNTPGLFELMALIGKESVLSRIQTALEIIQAD